MTTDEQTPEQRLLAAGVVLPRPPAAVARYVSVVLAGDLAFLAGHGPVEDGELAHIGRLGESMSIEEGQKSARCVALNILATLKQELGELDRVVRVVKTHVMVNSAPDFLDQPLVADGATELLVEAFGEARGLGARSAVGMASLPYGISVEIEGVVQIRQ